MSSEHEATPDETLAIQSQAGSLDAFEELVHRFERRIYRFVADACRNEADAREITQDTFLRAFRAIAQFDSRRAFAPWLFTIARHKCADHFRAAPPPSESRIPELPDHDDPACLLTRREDRENIWLLARRHLPETQYQALWFRYVEEMEIGQVAQVLGKTQTHVK